MGTKAGRGRQGEGGRRGRKWQIALSLLDSLHIPRVSGGGAGYRTGRYLFRCRVFSVGFERGLIKCTKKKIKE